MKWYNGENCCHQSHNMRAYHLDTLGFFEKNGVANLSHYLGLLPDAAQEYVLRHHPEGISYWGYRCLYTLSTIPAGFPLSAQQKTAILEWDIELVRQSRFPHSPSRFACLFAARSLDELKKYWCPALGGGYVWEVTSPHMASCLDASILTDLPPVSAGRPFDSSQRFLQICKYWEGFFSSQPAPELLLPLPCAAVSRLAPISPAESQGC